MRTGDVCRRSVVSAPRGMPLVEASRLMRENHVGSLVVVDDARKPVGIVTDRDIVVEVVAAGVDPRTIKIDEIMGPTLTTVSEEEDAQETLDLMRERGIRRLPVMNARGELSGIVSIDDVLDSLARELSDIVVAIRSGPAVEVRKRQ